MADNPFDDKNKAGVTIGDVGGPMTGNIIADGDVSNVNLSFDNNFI